MQPRASVPWRGLLLLALLPAALAVRVANSTLSPCSGEDWAKKDIDLVIFAATGFTGKFASHFIAKHPQAPARWALAARSRERLEALQQELQGAAKVQPEIVVVDLADYDSMLALARRARAIVTYAGPYEMLGGQALMRACIEGCAHYADVTGETAWVVEMIRKYEAQAKARGVGLVPSVGMDSLPADLLAVSAAEAVAVDGKGPPDEVTMVWTKLNGGGFSGASIVSGRYSVEHHGAVADPYILAPETPAKARVDKGLSGKRKLGFNEQIGAVVGTHPMAQQDCAVVRRSLAQRFPGAGISVADLSATNQLVASQAKYVADARMLREPPRIATKIGDTPPVWMEEKGAFAAEALALRAADGAAARMGLEGQGAPGYLGTARISAELALGLALEGASRGGFLTPSLALPGGTQALARRLNSSGYVTVREMRPALPAAKH